MAINDFAHRQSGSFHVKRIEAFVKFRLLQIQVEFVVV